MNDKLPHDPAMLLSVVNMKLRDRYASLDELCEDLGVDKAELCMTLERIHYTYNETLNRFQ